MVILSLLHLVIFRVIIKGAYLLGYFPFILSYFVQFQSCPVVSFYGVLQELEL